MATDSGLAIIFQKRQNHDIRLQFFDGEHQIYADVAIEMEDCHILLSPNEFYELDERIRFWPGKAFKGLWTCVSGFESLRPSQSIQQFSGLTPGKIQRF